MAHRNDIADDLEDLTRKKRKFSPKQSSIDSTKSAELKIACFIAEHGNIASVGHLSELISGTCQNDIKIDRTKCTRLINSVLAPALREELLRDVKGQYFSLIIDESTANGDTLKIICIMIRYFCQNSQRIITTFYRLLCFEDFYCSFSSETISAAVLKCLDQDGLPRSHLMGIGVENGSVMVDSINSIYTKLREEQPNLVLLGCISHSLALAASKAVEKLPIHLDFMIENTYGYFASSPKWQSQFPEICQLISDSASLKLLEYSPRRWLTINRYECIDRILSQWDELGSFFKRAADTEHSYTVDQLAEMYADKQNLLYLTFLKPILERITETNKLFQGENVNPLLLIDDLVNCYETILEKFVLPAHFRSLTRSTMREFDFEYYKRPDELIEIGYEARCIVETLPAGQRAGFYSLIGAFFVELAQQLKSRLPEWQSRQILEHIRLLDPMNAMTADKELIRPLLSSFYHIQIDRSRAAAEFASLNTGQWTREKLRNPIEFWTEVLEKEGDPDGGRFSNIARFALAVLSLPFSDSNVERAFSTMDLVKNRLRNPMQFKLLGSVLFVRSYLAWKNQTCCSIDITKRMLELFKTGIFETEMWGWKESDCEDVFKMI